MPLIKVFLSRDTAGMDGVNWYAYCNNNPALYTDPSGLLIVAVENYATTYEGATVTIKDEFGHILGVCDAYNSQNSKGTTRR